MDAFRAFGWCCTGTVFLYMNINLYKSSSDGILEAYFGF